MAGPGKQRRRAPGKPLGLRVTIVTPAPEGSRAGNRVTAQRIARLLRALGHRPSIVNRFEDPRAELAIVLHAARGAEAVRRARASRPGLPIVVVLTGTDIHAPGGLSRRARRALELADAIVGLQSHSVRELPASLRHKARVILQSYDGPNLRHRAPVRAKTGTRLSPGARRVVHGFVVLGHLRAEKDPFLPARALRRIPHTLPVRVRQAGKALTASMAVRARREARLDSRYEWLGELPRSQALRLLAGSRALILPSRVEGGPSVLSEAVALGVPVLASAIPQVVALLTTRHPGLFPAGSAAALAALMERTARDPSFEKRLAAASRRLGPRFAPLRERRAWERLIADVTLRRAVNGRRTNPAASRKSRAAQARRRSAGRAR